MGGQKENRLLLFFAAAGFLFDGWLEPLWFSFFLGTAFPFAGEPFDQPVGNISPKISKQVEQDGHEASPF